MAIITRRDLFKFLGGSAVGTLFTPVPWKLLDDVSIWTQNWSWIPVPPKGESRLRRTTCALCPAGCPVTARCIGDQPVSLSGAGGAQAPAFLCPVGLAGHHLRYHPLRLSTPVRLTRKGDRRERTPVALEQVVAAVAKALAEERAGSADGTVAILDTFPGRTASLAYRFFLSSWPRGRYIAPDRPGERAFRMLGEMTGHGTGQLGVDLGQSAGILGLGTGLFEGWGNPKRLFHLAAGEEKRLQLIQVETRQSNTATAAGSWLPVRPGTEAVFALGLAGWIVSEKLYEPKIASACPDLSPDSEFREFLSTFTPEAVARTTGISSEILAETARQITNAKPTVVLSGGDEGSGPLGIEADLAANILNVLLGSVGRAGGFVPRRALPAPEGIPPVEVPTVSDIAALPDGSLRVLIIDAAVPAPPIPEKLLRSKLDPDGSLVVCLSAIPAGYAELADYVVPTPSYLESLFDVPACFDAPAASLALSVPLLAPPAGAVAPLDFLKGVGEITGVDTQAFATDQLIESRIAAIWQSGQGSVEDYADGNVKAIGEFASAADLSQALREGALWVDTRQEPKPVDQIQLTGSRPEDWTQLVRLAKSQIEASPTGDPDYPLILMPFGSRFMAGVSSPVMEKLSRESDLYPRVSQALLNPSDAAAVHAAAGEQIQLETSAGSTTLRLRLDESVMPGIVFVPAFSFKPAETALDIRRLCTIGPSGTWRTTRARIRRLDV